RYVSSGHIVYIHAGTLFAAPFNLARRELEGPAVPVVDGVNAVAGTGAAQFALDAAGTLVYAAGQGGDINTPLLGLDGSGKSTTLRGARSNWGGVQFAPDGRRLALSITNPQPQIWVYEWANDTLSQLTFDPGTGSAPVWSPDGKYLAFAARRGSDAA